MNVSNTTYELLYTGQNAYALWRARAAALMYKIYQRKVKQSKTDVCCARQIFRLPLIFTSENLFALPQMIYPALSQCEEGTWRKVDGSLNWEIVSESVRNHKEAEKHIILIEWQQWITWLLVFERGCLYSGGPTVSQHLTLQLPLSSMERFSLFQLSVLVSQPASLPLWLILATLIIFSRSTQLSSLKRFVHYLLQFI